MKRPPDFTLSVWGFATPPLNTKLVQIAIACGRCRQELVRRVVAAPTAPAYDFAHDLTSVVEHYRHDHLEESLP